MGGPSLRGWSFVVRRRWAMSVLAAAVVACGEAQDVFLGGLLPGGDGDVPGAVGGLGGGDADGGQGGGGVGGVSGSELCTDLPLDESRLRILEGATGFGKDAFGGLDSCIVEVTSSADSGPGSLREVLESDVKAWVRFNVNTVVLEGDIDVRSHKTLDGSGSDVIIERYGLRLGAGVTNVVVHDLLFLGAEADTGSGGTTADEESDDAILIEQGARDIWIDHCDFSSYTDGLIDIIGGATNITISYNRFYNHRRVMLIGNENGGMEDAGTRVTIHHNWFQMTESYHPRLRRGWVHSFNNYLQQWENFGSGSSEGAQLASEANVYEAGSSDAATLTQITDDAMPGNLRSVGDYLTGDTVTPIITERNPDLVFDPADYYDYEADEAGPDLIESILSEAGTR